IGYLFAGINIVGTGYLSATEAALGSVIVSISRGVVAIILSALVMSWLFGMTGVWLAFTVAEALTATLLFLVLKKQKRSK
ncbi:MAG TPA: MATE family efflux transporter, partial [Oribacterium sp.]|nr:MATE family efflux transporter [Oribacterium sp.]